MSAQAEPKYKRFADAGIGELELANIIEQRAKTGDPLIINMPREADTAVVRLLARMIIHDLQGKVS